MNARIRSVTALTCLLACLLAVPATSDARKLHIGIVANVQAWGSQMGAEMDRIALTGTDNLREDVSWGQAEPTNGNWNWDAFDTLFQQGALHGMHILPVLGYPPCWAVPAGTPSDQCYETYPVNDADFADFVSRAVARYGPGGTFWNSHPSLDASFAPKYFEILNEPWYFPGQGDNARRYATLYKAAVVAGRGANPAAKYLVASKTDVQDPVTGQWMSWAKAMSLAVPNIGAYVDGIKVHPYSNIDPDTPDGGGTFAEFRNVARIYNDWTARDGLNINRPIWITEVGYSACDDPAFCVPGADIAAREQQKATWLHTIFSELGTTRYGTAAPSYGYVHAVYLYNNHEEQTAVPTLDCPEPFTDTTDPTCKNKEAWFGILDGNNAQTASYSVFSTAVGAHDGTPLPQTQITSSSVSGSSATYTFRSSDPTATFQCRHDGGTWTSCTTPMTYAGLASGSHTLSVRSVNDEGTDTSPASTTVTIG